MEISVLRPWAFVFLFPAVLFCFFRLRAVKTWLGIVDAHLLKPLLVRVCVRFGEGIKIGLLGLSCLSVLCALAGVSVSGRQKSLYFPKSPAVIVLDMSLSMKVQDISPNRFSRAVFKTYDLLDELKGIPTALIVFTDEPYQLVPTTTEKQAIEALLPLLNFNLLPSRGSRPDRAIEEALRTIKESGADFGDIFLITDGADDILELQDKTADLIRLAAGQGNRLFILGIGTPQGGVLFEKEDAPVLDALGNPVFHRLKEGWLRRLAGLGNGRYVRARTDGSDIAALINAQKSRLEAGEQSALTDDQSFSDEGYWFLILPLSVFPFLFRRGRLLGVLFIFAFSPEALAADAAELFLSPSAAAMRFLNGGNQAKAIEIAGRSDDFTALYNIGTQLIFLQNYSKAQELLEKAVQKRPEDENAQINLEIARRLNQPPPSDSPENNSNDETQNPDNSGEKEGESEGQNNLNQDDNNDPQPNDNKENNENEKSGNSENSPPGSADDEKNAGNDQSDQNGPSGGGHGKGGAPEDREGSPDQDNNGSGDPGNGENSENRTENPDNMVPVHEDPLTLLRHKILFLYQEKRYADEKPIGTQW
ncbi:MAG: VWA domain-containing protein [Alphaproteobacteria bacterium]|nr:VWA domain-containing protein [Alphaproteobacteria bacterium]